METTDSNSASSEHDIQLFRDLSATDGASGLDLVLKHYDPRSKAAIFDYSWERLQASQGNIDLATLRLCVRLLPPGKNGLNYHDKLCTLIIDDLPKESQDPGLLYAIAQICLSNIILGERVFFRIFKYLELLNIAIKNGSTEIVYGEMSSWVEDQTAKALSYLNFLKCSYWLPAERNHFVTPELVQTVVNYLGCDILNGLDHAAHDVLSALLALLRTPVTLFQPPNKAEALLIGSSSTLPTLDDCDSFIGQKLWNRFRDLQDDYFDSNSSRVFRTWFQWVSYAESRSLELEGIYSPLYWARVRRGLLKGFAEQRKYCIGILRRSLSLVRQSIDAPDMMLDVSRRREYERQYEKYSVLFETIVLDRYPNQVQACLPELTKLLGPGALIASGWVKTLISAALDPKMQDGVRKLIGRWYMEFVAKEQGVVVDHATEGDKFLVDGFLPWATQGTLFTSSLSSTREITICAHGNALVDMLTKFILMLPTALDRRLLLVNVLQSVLDRGGKLFSHSVLYLLEGLLNGFRVRSTFADLEPSDLELVVQISRLTGLPEIAGDFCTVMCAEFCKECPSFSAQVPGFNDLMLRFERLLIAHAMDPIEGTGDQTIPELMEKGTPLQVFILRLEHTQHMSIQDSRFETACDEVSIILDEYEPELGELYTVLEALWDEAERQEFRRLVVIKLPSLIFHPCCLQVLVKHSLDDATVNEEPPLTKLYVKAVDRLRKLGETRTYLLSILLESLRKACFSQPKVVTILPLEELLVQYIEKPPLPKKELLFEASAAETLQRYIPHRTYDFYYGRREWHAYANLIDLLAHFPADQADLTKRVLRRLIEPWQTQKAPIPIITKWKNAFQLQIMLVLSEICISDSDAEWYLDSFRRALILEPWPRYRYLLEWIISRIYYRHKHLAPRILIYLSKSNDADPRLVASLIKLAILVAPLIDSEEFALQLMLHLIPFSASSKVQVRHEAHFSFPIIWDLAVQKGWKSIVENSAFQALNDYIRTLDRFNAGAFTIRTLKLNVVQDFTIFNIFQGDYLRLETPEREMVAYEDFVRLQEDDMKAGVESPPPSIPLGHPKYGLLIAPHEDLTRNHDAKGEFNNDRIGPFQTKSGFDLSSLIPSTDLPNASLKRPASVVLVASLIDNPTNLGGLSRISESFGLECLYISSLTHLTAKDFQSTAVTSYKHLPIKELKPASIPAFLIALKRQGYEVVAVEQTDRSGILGESNSTKERGYESVGMLPKKCVLVLGSEKGGVNPEVLAVVDRCVEIRTVGVTRSLNVQTAAGIVAFEWWREWGGTS
ncbi:hypothetical protein CC78DRAFT_621091 [Lojkania enalia]|uniref:tRNA/rRNA methyltransferase SpoU type domain-containing protein n=1 Tax=Lojkania enalia TaxID=147567 RepID=A0A9P4K0T8_9PLEO|nr:hypothetical protein CC78DRAFT_621091 [Didymosphaeria enalia]